VQRPTGGSATSHLGRWDVAAGNAERKDRHQDEVEPTIFHHVYKSLTYSIFGCVVLFRDPIVRNLIGILHGTSKSQKQFAIYLLYLTQDFNCVRGTNLSFVNKL